MTSARSIVVAGAIALAASAGVAGCGGSDAQSGGAPIPFKLGTFERTGRVYIGLVLNDTQVVDIAAANAAYEAANASAPKLPAAGRHEGADRRATTANGRRGWRPSPATSPPPSSAPPYVAEVAELRVHPPVRPSLILNAGGNYVEHTAGIAAQAAAGRRRRPKPASAGRDRPRASGSAPPATPATTRICSRSRRPS